MSNSSIRSFRVWPCLFGVTLLGAWFLSAEVSDAWKRRPTAQRVAAGQELFEHEWSPNDPQAAQGDGLGPVFNARSCTRCHFQGGVGGGGPNEVNVVSFEALPTSNRPKLFSSVVHAFATDPALRETTKHVNEMFPVIKGGVRVIDGCSFTVADFDPVVYQTINTPALFGAGLIDEISETSLKLNGLQRTVSAVSKSLDGDFTTAPVGRLRIVRHGRVGRFGWKGQFATLEEFVATACAVELGLTNPLRAQDVPQHYVQDRAAKLDINEEQLQALVCFLANLPRPQEVPPSDPEARRQAEHGKELFSSIGCADCHTPNMGHVVGIYSDFRLHDLEDKNRGSFYRETLTQEANLPKNRPEFSEWKTPPLWGVADTAPYFHDGSASTLDIAILRHGGQASQSRKKFEQLPPSEQNALIAFLQTLRAPGVTRTNS